MSERIALYRLLEDSPVSRRTVYNWMQQGVLPYHLGPQKTRFVDRRAFEELLQVSRRGRKLQPPETSA